MTSQQKGFKGPTHYLTGVTTEIRQKYRDEVPGTRRESSKARAGRRRRFCRRLLGRGRSDGGYRQR